MLCGALWFIVLGHNHNLPRAPVSVYMSVYVYVAMCVFVCVCVCVECSQVIVGESVCFHYSSIGDVYCG